MTSENPAEQAKHNAGRAKERPGSAQDAAEQEVSGARQGTDHSPPSPGDAAENAADSVPNQTDD